MDFRLFLSLVVFLSVAVSCQQGAVDKAEKSVEEIMSDSKISNAEIVRNPVSANEPEDTLNIARITFEETAYDFGEVREGEVVIHHYRFRNTGKAPLVISSARSTCGCTIPEWPDHPIQPGEEGQIEVRFNTMNKKNKQSKPITIIANTYPSATKVFLNGFVKPADEVSD